MANYAVNRADTPDALIELARQAMKRGEKQQAHHYLQQAARLNPNDFMVWLWLASVAPNAQASLDYVRRAEQLNNTDPRVHEARAWAEKRWQETHQAQPPTLPPLPAETKQKKIPTAVVIGSLLVILVIVIGIAGLALTLLNQNTAVAAQNSTLISQNSLPLAPASIELSSAVVNNQPVEPTHTPKPIVPAKNLAAASNDQPRPTWTITPTPTNTPTPTPTWVPTFVSNGGQAYLTRPYGVKADEKWIDVNLSNQTLTAYIGNDAVFDTYISSGTADHPTVTGQFRIWLEYESQTMDGSLLGYDYFLENVPYVMYFYEDYALHGTFWHNNFGTPMSHGCVNMETGDAGWIFSWASVGTLVNVHN